MQANIAVVAGDGIGPEVIGEGVRALGAIASARGHDFTFTHGLIGGCAIDAIGDSLPPETLELCEAADAILLGAVGGPQWSDPTAPIRPEQGLLQLRKHFELFANLRPIVVYPALAGHAPLRADLLDGVDILVVRELTGGIYFGEREELDDASPSADSAAWDMMRYSVGEVERVARVAFEAARGRRKRVASVDKANVLAASRLWRRVVTQVAADYPDVELEHVLVDACAMFLVRNPARFDVLLTGNMFGDILSDEASVLAGSLGMLPSASLGEGRVGLYEPIHGSAPDIAGQGIANPVGALLSCAMLLRYSLSLEDEARALEGAIERALVAGFRTADIAAPGETPLATRAFADEVLTRLMVVEG
jgi:3-isopropylmalate dehydrogenase